MDGVFMKKWLILLGLLAIFVYMGSIVADKQQLTANVLRLHVVANSDSAEDQAIKLKVRDAVLTAAEAVIAGAEDKAQAQTMLAAHLENLEAAANTVLDELGCTDRAQVTLTEEAFSTREYDTFTLPAGVYDALRVTIGEGQGRNWWCVVFPSLCIPAASENVEDAAAGAGFSDSLSGAITGQPKYQVRFYFMDALGRLENFFRKG